MIHYGDTKKLKPRTACGLNFNLLLDACLSGDVDSVDCANCLASNECRAEAMERALVKPEPRDLRAVDYRLKSMLDTDMYERS